MGTYSTVLLHTGFTSHCHRWRREAHSVHFITCTLQICCLLHSLLPSSLFFFYVNLKICPAHCVFSFHNHFWWLNGVRSRIFNPTDSRRADFECSCQCYIFKTISFILVSSLLFRSRYCQSSRLTELLLQQVEVTVALEIIGRQP